MAVIPSLDSIGPLRLLHNHYRLALLNKKYYGARLEKFQWQNRVSEIVIAAGAAGSGIAGLALWKSDDGIVIWGALSAASIILATVKPLLDWPKSIERYAKLWGEWSSMHSSLEIIEEEVRGHGRLTTEQVEAVQKLRERLPALAALDDPSPDPAVVKRYTEEVNREIPPSRLWMPGRVAPPPRPAPAAPDAAVVAPPIEEKP